jgi:hypothetical protein
VAVEGNSNTYRQIIHHLEEEWMLENIPHEREILGNISKGSEVKEDLMTYLGLFDHRKGLPVDRLRIERVGRLYQRTHPTFSNFRFIPILENVKVAYQSTNLIKRSFNGRNDEIYDVGCSYLKSFEITVFIVRKVEKNVIWTTRQDLDAATTGLRGMINTFYRRISKPCRLVMLSANAIASILNISMAYLGDIRANTIDDPVLL